MEETSRHGKFSSAIEEEEEADAAVLVRPVRTVANNEAERNKFVAPYSVVFPDVVIGFVE